MERKNKPLDAQVGTPNDKPLDEYIPEAHGDLADQALSEIDAEIQAQVEKARGQVAGRLNTNER